MSKAIVTIGANTADYEAGIARAQAGMRALSTTAKDESIKAQKAIERASSGDAKTASRSNARMANISAQIQDVAVQAQMGANIGTIVAQQGGQLISALGGSGKLAVFAGVATVAAAVVSLGVAGNEAFAKMIKGASDFGKELRNITAGGTLSEIVAGVGGAATQIEALNEQQKSLDKSQGGGLHKIATNFRQSWANLRNFSTSGAQDELTASEEAQFEIQREMNAAVSVAIELGKKEVQIAQLKAKGYNEEADTMQRKLDLDRAREKILANDKIPKRLVESQIATIEGKAKAKEAEIEKKRVDDIIDHERKQKQDFIEFQKRQDDDLRDFEKRQLLDFHAEVAKDDMFFANLEFQAMTEFYDEEERRINKARELKISGEKRASDALADAQGNINDAQEKRMSLSDQITLASGRLLQSEKMVAQTQKFGTKEAQDAAQAKMIQARGELQQLSLRRASQFVGKSSADIRRSERDAAKDQKELEKAGKRLVEADIRKADAANRRAGGLGLTDAQKEAMRVQGAKGQGKDIQQAAAERSAKALENIETDMKDMAKKLGVAK